MEIPGDPESIRFILKVKKIEVEKGEASKHE
jgi:hypothetical protein